MLAKLLLCLPALCWIVFAGESPNAETIIRNSVAANNVDFKVADDFAYDERVKTPEGTKTYSVTMIEGTPYERLIAINDEPLSPAAAAQEEQKLRNTIAKRRRETPAQRRSRINKYQAERRRNATMLDQLTVAFNFQLAGTGELDGFSVYKLKATPKPGYRPPNMSSQVLLGMEGCLWIDQKTFHWVKVTARVIRPVSIEGFLARVEPGTLFEIEKRPVSGGIWQITHYSMQSHAKVLYLINRSSQDDETYFNFRRISGAGSPQTTTLR